MNRTYPAFLVCAALTLGACVSDDESVEPAPQPGTAAAGFSPRYVPLGGLVPIPNDLFFIGSEDGTLNLPVADPSDLGDPLVAMNHVDGFSTNAPIRVRFTAAIDAGTLSGNVHVLEVDVDPNTTATVGFRGMLTEGTDYTLGIASAADSGGKVLEITPTHPLDSGLQNTGTNIGYLVVVTRGVESAGGAAAEPDNDYQAILNALASGGSTGNGQLDSIAQLVGAHLQIAGAVGISSSDVAVSFSFTTQDPDITMQTLADNAESQGPSTLANTGVNTKMALDPEGTNPNLFGIADIYVGAVGLPYYLSASDPLGGFWTGAGDSNLTRFNPAPVEDSTQTVPVMATIPNATSGCAMPPGGWPTVIFQHGITQNRTNLLPIAEALASICHAGVAIDHPLHGITDTESPFYMEGLERTFDLDVADNSSGAAGPDGVIDDSGTHYINLASLLTTRDNLRQSAVDIIHFGSTVEDLDLDGSELTDEFQLTGFVGHSLGGIAGATALGSVSDESIPSTLAMPGGNISQLILNSPSIGSQVIAGLAANGLQQGTSLFEEFFRNAQTVIDAGDPINYAAAAGANHPIHMIEVVGDQVVPNIATQLLADEMGLTKITALSNLDPSGIRGRVVFTAGDHGSILDPTASGQATAEMQRQMAEFMASGGASLTITDATVVDTNP